jgi:hypothetical protein
MTACRRVEVELHTFLFGSIWRWVVSRNSGKGAQYPCVGSRDGQDVMEKTKISYIGQESKDSNEPPEERAAIVGKCMRVPEDV